jgi:acetyl/propionyl-CoA carboxylase alpha subunit
MNGRQYRVRSMKIGADLWLHVNGQIYVVSPEIKKKSSREGSGVESDGQVLAPMPGKILKVNISEGAAVEANQVLIVMEAMKMEYSLSAPIQGRVKSLAVKVGELVELNQMLVEVEKT